MNLLRSACPVCLRFLDPAAAVAVAERFYHPACLEQAGLHGGIGSEEGQFQLLDFVAVQLAPQAPEMRAHAVGQPFEEMNAGMAAPATGDEPAQFIDAGPAMVHQDVERCPADGAGAAVPGERRVPEPGKVRATQAIGVIAGAAASAGEDRRRAASAQ